MTDYQKTNADNIQISEAHMRSLVEESGISPDVIAERGYRTAVHRDQLRRYFPRWQRRAPALFIPLYSPDGETKSAQIRPDKVRINQKGKPVKYETPAGSDCILDVHPRNADCVKDPTIPVWIGEGAKKNDSLTTRGECAVTVVGVWNWTKDGEVYPCFDHIPLEGRIVRITFDSDMLLIPEVQLAAERLAEVLIARGAVVEMAYFPDLIPNGKTGVDDYLASGKTVADLKALCVPFTKEDVKRRRLERMPALACRIKELHKTGYKMPAAKRAEFTRRSVYRAYVTLSEQYGKKHPEGVKVTVSTRTIAEIAAVGQSRVPPTLKALEADGYLRREQADRKPDKPGAIILLCDSAVADHQHQNPSKTQKKVVSAVADHKGGRITQNKSISTDTYDPGDPQLRYGADLPEMRWSCNLRAREVDEMTGEVYYVYEHLKRAGKKSAAVAEYVAVHGSATVAELAQTFGTAAEQKRKWDFRRRHIDTLLSPAVVTMDGDTVEISPQYKQAIEDARALGLEQEAAKRQKEDHKRQREAFRRRAEAVPDPVPDKPKVDDLSTPWSQHQEGCACKECVSRFGKVIGEHVWGCRCADCHTTRKAGKPAPVKHLLVYTNTSQGSAEAAAEPGEPSEDHPLDCECMDCSYTPRRCATAVKGGA